MWAVVKLAGMVGFEPTVHCTKNSCLTTWLHPNRGGVSTPKGFLPQPLNSHFLLIVFSTSSDQTQGIQTANQASAQDGGLDDLRPHETK